MTLHLTPLTRMRYIVNKTELCKKEHRICLDALLINFKALKPRIGRLHGYTMMNMAPASQAGAVDAGPLDLRSYGCAAGAGPLDLALSALVSLVRHIASLDVAI